jgi:hypothetical protein
MKNNEPFVITAGPDNAMTEASRYPVLSNQLPASGNAALAASALTQAALGIEFALSGLNKLFDSNYLGNFSAFMRSSPGAARGLLSPLVRTLVLPEVGVFAPLIEVTELVLGVVFLVGAAEIARRRFAGRLGARHGYEATLALVACIAGLVAAGLSLSIAMLLGEGLPTVTPGNAFMTAIPVELLIVPLGLAIAWVEFGRFLVLRRKQPQRLPLRSDRVS